MVTLDFSVRRGPILSCGRPRVTNRASLPASCALTHDSARSIRRTNLTFAQRRAERSDIRAPITSTGQRADRMRSGHNSFSTMTSARMPRIHA